MLIIRTILLLIIASCVACAPGVTYSVKDGDPASPQDGKLVFSLRTSKVVVSPPANKSKAGNKDATDTVNAVVNVCTELDPNNPAGMLPIKSDEWQKCFLGVTTNAVPARDTSAWYLASPSKGTTLTATAVGTDPLMIKSVSVNYKNPATTALAAASAALGGVATGFGVGGPWGAAVGGVITAAATILPSKAITSKPLFYQMCPIDLVELMASNKEECSTLAKKFVQSRDSLSPDEQKKLEDCFKVYLPKNEDPLRLFLPVVLDSEPVIGNEFSQCWHPLPGRSDDPKLSPEIKKEPIKLSGWFYRFAPDMPPKSELPPVLTFKKDSSELENLHTPFEIRDQYFSSAIPASTTPVTPEKNTFPVSACRAVKVEITWWKTFERYSDKDESKPVSYPVLVAEPNYIQPLLLPQNGTISLLPVCGGYENSSQVTNTTSESIDPAVKQAQAIKEAQSKW